MAGRVWLLTRELFDDLLLGPAIRVLDIVSNAAQRGQEVTVLAARGSKNPFPRKVAFGELRSGFSRLIAKGDGVIVGELLPSKAIFELLRSRHPFHWDVYGLSLPETLSFAGAWAPSRTRADSRRKAVRYAVLSRAAQSIWVSNAYQMAFLSAFLASTGQVEDARSAAELPTKVVEAPMGCRSDRFRLGAENPYAAQSLHGPVFLWGGGIWNWFDVQTVVRAFALLERRGVPGTLFFISGRNEATSDYDEPLVSTRRLIEELNLPADRVVFNATRVGPDGLAPWLEHCVAGVMGNKPTLESRMCWRTRYLDLLWAGRPLVVSGSDPLADIMDRAGAALVVPAGDAERLADALAKMSTEVSMKLRMSEAARGLGLEFASERTLLPALDALDSLPCRGRGPTVWEIFRYILGM